MKEYRSRIIAANSDRSLCLFCCRWEEIQQHRAQLAKAWVRYGLVLFNVSKTRLVAMHYGEPNHVIDNVWVSSSGELYEMKSKGSKEQTSFDDGPFVDGLTSVDNSQELGFRFNELNQVEVGKQEDGISLIKSVVSKINNLDEDVEMRSSDEESKEKSDGEKSTISKSDIELEEHMSGYSSLGGEDEGTPERNSEISSDEIEMKFPTLDLSEIEELVKFKMVETQVEAEDLYNFTNTWIKHYRQYFDFNSHPTEFVNNILDKSELFRYLAFFSEGIER